MLEFENLIECIEYNHSTLIVDLKNYIGPCTQPAYYELFKPPLKGIYLKGELQPIVDLTKPHYLRHNTQEGKTAVISTLPLVTNLEMIKGQKASVIDELGNVRLSSQDIYRLYSVLSEDPGCTYQAVKAAAYFALSFLDSWCKHSRINPPCSYKEIFKEEAWHLVEDESLDVFKQLKLTIASFVGEDNLYLYFYRLKDSTLYIQKNMDYRVYDYYVRKFSDD